MMNDWDNAKKYLLFYAKDNSIIPRRDIRNQLYDAVDVGDRMKKEINQYTAEIAHYILTKTLLEEKLKEKTKNLETIQEIIFANPMFRFEPTEMEKTIHQIIKLLDNGKKEKICPELEEPCYAPSCPMIKGGVCQLNPTIYKEEK